MGISRSGLSECLLFRSTLGGGGSSSLRWNPSLVALVALAAGALFVAPLSLLDLASLPPIPTPLLAPLPACSAPGPVAPFFGNGRPFTGGLAGLITFLAGFFVDLAGLAGLVTFLAGFFADLVGLAGFFADLVDLVGLAGFFAGLAACFFGVAMAEKGSLFSEFFRTSRRT